MAAPVNREHASVPSTPIRLLMSLRPDIDSASCAAAGWDLRFTAPSRHARLLRRLTPVPRARAASDSQRRKPPKRPPIRSAPRSRPMESRFRPWKRPSLDRLPNPPLPCAPPVRCAPRPCALLRPCVPVPWPVGRCPSWPCRLCAVCPSLPAWRFCADCPSVPACRLCAVCPWLVEPWLLCLDVDDCEVGDCVVVEDEDFCVDCVFTGCHPLPLPSHFCHWPSSFL